MKKKHIAFDITLTLKKEVHGIANVERQIKHILETNPDLKDCDITYIYYLAGFGWCEYKQHDTSVVEKTESFVRSMSINLGVLYKFIRYNLATNLFKPFRPIRIKLRHNLYKTFAKYEKYIKSHWQKWFQRFVLKNARRTAEFSYIKNQITHNHHLQSLVKNSQIKFDQFTHVLLVSLLWDEDLRSIVNAKKEHQFKLIIMLYDLIPVRNPETCGGLPQPFVGFLDLLYWNADIILTDSKYAKQDLISFIDENGGEFDSDKIIPLQLGSEDLRNKPHNLQRQIDILNSYNLIEKKYVVIVCTIEPRKNHRLLVNIWRHLVKNHPNEVIPLVIVGAHGWHVNDFMQELFADYLMKQHIVITGKIETDAKNILLSCARFSVFPSFSEGWGLGVSESLCLGTPCIVANNTSLVEAGQGLCDAIDLIDSKKWYETILEYMTNDDLINQKRKEIMNAKLRTFDDVENDFVEILKKI